MYWRRTFPRTLCRSVNITNTSGIENDFSDFQFRTVIDSIIRYIQIYITWYSKVVTHLGTDLIRSLLNFSASPRTGVLARYGRNVSIFHE